MAFTCAFSNGFSSGFAICPPEPVEDVPRQIPGSGSGVFQRLPVYDHIASVRTDAGPVRTLRLLDRDAERITRQELVEV